MRLPPAIHREHLEAFPNRVFGKLIPEALAGSRIVSDEHLDKVDHLRQELALLADAHAHRCEIVQQPSHLFQVKLVWRGFQHMSDANQTLHPAGARSKDGKRATKSSLSQGPYETSSVC